MSWCFRVVMRSPWLAARRTGLRSIHQRQLTEIAIYVAKHLPKRAGTLIQAEDEIAAISQVLGAWLATALMTATSGPGLSLMSEMLGMAFHDSEMPCVIRNPQRGGPSTGLLTKHEQSDLFLAIHGAHGGALCCRSGNVADCISLTVTALTPKSTNAR